MNVRILCLSAATLLCGCGTMMTVGENRAYPVQAYSGIQAGFRNGLTHTLLDVPFSAAADTVVLPYTVPATIVNLSTPPARRKNAGVLGDDIEGTQPSTLPSTQPTTAP